MPALAHARSLARGRAGSVAPRSPRRAVVALPRLLAACACGGLLAGCASSVSTSSFKGEQHAAAQAVANLQSDATAGDEKKICTLDLAARVVTRLGGQSRCESAIKDQLSEIDNLEVSVQSVSLGPAARNASATVKSTYSGKSRPGKVALVKEGGRWKVAGFG